MDIDSISIILVWLIKTMSSVSTFRGAIKVSVCQVQLEESFSPFPDLVTAVMQTDSREHWSLYILYNIKNRRKMRRKKRKKNSYVTLTTSQALSFIRQSHKIQKSLTLFRDRDRKYLGSSLFSANEKISHLKKNGDMWISQTFM